MAGEAYNQLVSELARDLVASVAPQESPLFPALSEAYFRDPRKLLADQKPRDEALGFGVGEAVTFVTPVILAVVTDVVKYLVAHVSESVKKESAGVADEAVKRLFKKFHPAQEQTRQGLQDFGAEQVVTVRRLAFEKACQLKLPTDQASLLADSLAGALIKAS